MLPKMLLQGPSSLPDVTSGALVTRDGVDDSLSPQFWNRVLGVDQLLPECSKWIKSNPDVQVAEHSADGLGQTMDVWDSYRCSRCLSLILVCLGESEPLHKSSQVAILLQCFLQPLLFLGSTYT